MFFLKKRSFDNPEPNENAAISSQNLNTADLQSPPNPNLLGRLSLFQNFRFPPDSPFENEAWAPETTNVRLFHKDWSIEEEQISSSSGPQ